MKYDVVVIGSGPGGYVAALRAAQLGLKTACIEKENTFGGTCLNVGCIPSKTLLHTTEQLDWIQHASQEQGISISSVSIDFAKMMQRKEQVVKGLTQGIAGLFKAQGVTPIFGSARLVSPHNIEVTREDKTETVEAANIILATGSESISLPFLPFDEKIVVSSTGALALPSIPKRMLVIGGGVIGVELASVYKRLGTEITIVEMLDRICPTIDDAISKSLLQILKKQGLTFHLSSKVTKADIKSNNISLTIEHDANSFQLEADVVLVAIGRKPYTTGLGLKEIGITTEKGIIPVDANFRTLIPNIFAIGDIIEGPMLAHRASEEGTAVAEIIADRRPQINYLAIPNVIYTHPEVASVGLTETEAKALGQTVSVGISSFRANARARCNGYTEGMVKVIGIGKEGYIVGMHIIGPQASELINGGVIAIEKRATLHQLATSPTAHPTLAEAIKEACIAVKIL